MPKAKIIAIIPARIGSKRLKYKNIKKIKNKTLIEIVISVLSKSKIFSDIFVSTDSEIIKKISKGIIFCVKVLGKIKPLTSIVIQSFGKSDNFNKWVKVSPFSNST